MRFSLPNNLPKAAGFTLIEVLIIAPVVILVISGFVALMIALTSDVLSTREQSVLAFETQDALDRIEQDTRLTTQFLVTSGTQLAPQGSDNNFTGTAAFSNTNSLIMGGLTTDVNPVATTRQLIYYAKQPNDCGALQTYNRVFQAKIVYFIKNGSLWRRSLVPPYNTNATADDNTVCATPWQRNSCSPGSSGVLCETNDVEVMRGIKTFTVKYYSAPGSTTDIGSAQALSATTIEVIIEGEKTIAGRTIAASGTVRGTKLNNIDVDLPPPSTPSLSGVANATSAVFTWSKVPVATSYVVSHNINGGAWTDVTLNAQATSYTVNANLNDTVSLRVAARNATGTSPNAQASVTIPIWNSATLQNGWSNYGDSFSTAAYTKTTNDVVFLKGVIRGGGTSLNTVLFTLPAAYRPAYPLVFLTDTSGPSSTGTAARINVYPDGNVTIEVGWQGWLMLDGIRFVAGSASYAWTDLAFEPANAWSNYGGGYSPIRYTSDTSGRTHIQGLIKSGDYAVDKWITVQFPTALRSPSYLHFPAMANNAFNYVGVQTRISAKGVSASSYMSTQFMFYPSYTGWQDITLLAGWAWFGSPYTSPQYYKSADKVVSLKGLIRNGSTPVGTVIGTLPVGYRPKEKIAVASVSASQHARVDIHPNGNIVLDHHINTGWLSLDNIHFIAEQ